MRTWTVNTSNLGKQAEFRSFLGENTKFLNVDLNEPDADALTIIRYKASQFDSVLVDDTSLSVEGAEVDTNIRWLLKELKNFIGREATFCCYLGILRAAKVEVFVGKVEGQMVQPRGASFGFNNFFLPKASNLTLGEKVSNRNNARFHAIQSLLRHHPAFELEPLRRWGGRFQADK